MKKSTTRITAILIALVMLIGCSVGMISAFASPNYDADTVAQMKAALTAYENKFTGANAGKIYNNMAAAYNAYVKLSNDLDLYYYANGGNSEVTSGQISNDIGILNTAVSNMTVWSSPGAATTANMGNDDLLFYESNTNDNKWSAIKSQFNGVIWAQKNYNPGAEGSKAESASVRGVVDQTSVSYYLCYPAYVLLWDGSTKPTFGVLLEGDTEKSGNGGNNYRYFYGASLLASAVNQGMSLERNWTAQNANNWSNTSRDFGWNLFGGYSFTRSGAELTAGTGKTHSMWLKNNAIGSRKSYHKSTSNIVTYNGTSSTDFVLSIYPAFTTYTGSNEDPSKNSPSFYGDIALNITGSQPVYVLNYKALVDVLTNFSKTLTNISNYKEGGLTAAMAAFDEATKYNYNTDFNTDYNESGIASKMSDVNSKFTGWKTAMTSNITADGYTALRTAIDNTTKTYFEDTTQAKGEGGKNPMQADGLNVKYCPTPWNTFAEYYKQAGTVSGVMYSGAKNNYNNGSQAASLATLLTTAYGKLTLHQQDSTANWVEIPATDAKYKKATCTENGLGVEYSKCANCMDNNFIVNDAKEITAKGHTSDTCQFTPESTQSCTEPGTPAYWQCVAVGDDLHENGCGKYFDDNDGEVGEELPGKPEELPKEGHDLRKINTQREATCQQVGYKENIYQCDQCHNYYLIDDDQNTDQPDVSIEYVQANEIPKKPHNEDYTPAEEATCTVEGHDAYYYCDMCKHYFSTEADASLRQDLGVKAPGTYLLAHDFQNPQYQNDQDCITNGSVISTCTMCPATEITYPDEYKAVGHKFGADSKTERVLPTCITPGNVEYYTCSECDKHFNTDNIWSVAEVPDNQLVIPATGMHSFDYHSKREATCTEQGHEAYYSCSVCSKAFDTDQQDADDDTFDTVHGINPDDLYTTGQHKLITHSNRTATCQVKGYERYYECAYCTRLFKSNDQGDDLDKFDEENEITNFDGDGDDAWAKLGSHSIYSVTGVVANCVEGGEEDHYECIYCDTWFSDPDGVDEIEDVQITDPDPNNHYGHFIEHSEQTADCTQEGWSQTVYECSECGCFYSKVDGSKTEVDDYLGASIEDLGDIYTEVQPHNSEGTRETAIVIQDSTCYYEGSQIRYKYCTVCEANQEFVTESIPMKAHTPKSVGKQNPTCKAEGLEAHNECSVPECGKLFAAEDTTCSGAPITRESIVIPSVGHDFSVEGTTPVTEATCNTNAIYEYTCSYNCGTSENHEKADTMTGHNLEPHAQKDATCLENGVPATYYSCDICNRNYTDNDKYTTNIYSGYLSSPATGHTFKLVDDNAKAATCHEKGELAYYICTNDYCDISDAKFLSNADNMAEEGIKSNDELIIAEDMKNHTALAFVEGTPATCEGWKSGVRAHNYCADCSSYYEVSDVNYDTRITDEKVFDEDPTHTLVDRGDKPATCLDGGYKQHWECTVCHQFFTVNDANAKNGVDYDENIAISAKGHKFGAYIKEAPTCLTDGIEGHFECSECHIAVICDEADKELDNVKFYKGNDTDKLTIDATGHSFQLVDTDAKDATCMAEGVKAHYICTNNNCDLGDAWFLSNKNTKAESGDDKATAFVIEKDPNNHVNLSYYPEIPADCVAWTSGTRANYHCACGVYYELEDFVDRTTAKSAADFVIAPKHTLEDKGDKPATCLNGGYKQHWECTVCNQYFTENNATIQNGVDYNTEILLNASGHNIKKEIENEVPGTDCQHYGTYEEVSYCQNAWCELKGAAITSETKTGDKVGPHVPGEAAQENVVSAKCETAGSYDLVTRCTLCKEETDIKANQVIDPTGHKNGEVKIENEKKGADCQHFGTYEEVVYCANEWCEVDGGKVLSRVQKETTEVGDHVAGTPQRDNVVEATCEKDGSFDLVTKCELCDFELARVKDQVINKTDHKAGAAKIENEKDGVDCQHFGSYDEVIYCENEWCDIQGGKELSRVQKDTDKLGEHKAGEPKREEVEDATCTANGSYDLVTRCEVCNEELDRVKDQVITAEGHKWSDWKTVDSPDCLNGGSQKRTCDVCGVVEDKNLKPNGHTWEKDYTIDVAPNCTTQGSKSIHCKNCDAQKDSVPVSALGHDWVTDKAVESTVTETGLTEGKHCSRCDAVVPQEVTPNKLAILEGANQTYVIASGKEKTIRCSGPINMFVELLLEGKHVDEANYTLKEGSTIVTFKSAFLNTLTPGVYKVTLVYTYDSIDTTLTVVEKSTETSTETSTEASTEKPTETPSENTTEATTQAPAENTTKPNTEATTGKDKAPVSNNSSTSPGTGFVLSIPVLSLAALAGSSFFLGYARKKKNEDEE